MSNESLCKWKGNLFPPCSICDGKKTNLTACCWEGEDEISNPITDAMVSAMETIINDNLPHEIQKCKICEKEMHFIDPSHAATGQPSGWFCDINHNTEPTIAQFRADLLNWMRDHFKRINKPFHSIETIDIIDYEEEKKFITAYGRDSQ